MSAPRFHVFVEGPRSAAAEAIAQLAAAMGAHYGLAPGELAPRLAAGRFRVKSNVDRATAEAFAADLERLGARCSIEAAAPSEPPSQPRMPAPASPSSLSQPRMPAPASPSSLSQPRMPAPASPSSLSQPRMPAPASPSSLNQPRMPAPMNPGSSHQSPDAAGEPDRLSTATFHGAGDEDGLNALSGEMKLALLDGGEDLSSGERSAELLPASFGPPSQPAMDVPPTAAAPRPAVDADPGPVSSAPASPTPSPAASDRFAPPDDSSELPLVLDVDKVRKSQRSAAAAPLPAEPSDRFAPPDDSSELPLALEVDKPRKAQRAAISPSTITHERDGERSPPAAATPRSGSGPSRDPVAPAAWTRDPRASFAVAVAVSAVLGFVPASLVASVRERSAFARIDAELEDRQTQVVDRADWDALDGVRAAYAERKRAERQSIAFTSLILWVVVSGGLAWVWFRKLQPSR